MAVIAALVLAFERLDTGGIFHYSYQMPAEAIVFAMLAAALVTLARSAGRIAATAVACTLCFLTLCIKGYTKFYLDLPLLSDLTHSTNSAGDGLQTLPGLDWRRTELIAAGAFMLLSPITPKLPLKPILLCLAALSGLIASYAQAGLASASGSAIHMHSPSFFFYFGSHADENYDETTRATLKRLVTKGQGVERVIVVGLESIRSDLATPSLMPNLHALMAAGISTRHFANATQTIRSEIAIYCSALDNLHGYTYAQVASAPRECLPGVLAKRGWRTIYVHGNSGTFFNRQRFMPLIGFQEPCFKDCLEAKGYHEQMGWGITDRESVKASLDLLMASPKPTLVGLMTLSNHFPFKWSYAGMDAVHQQIASQVGQDDPLRDYKLGHVYTDDALAPLVKLAQQRHPGIMIVLTGDHGVYLFGRDTPAHLREYHYMSTPLVIIGARERPRTGVITTHLDIAPTILSHTGGAMTVLGDAISSIEPGRSTQPVSKFSAAGFVDASRYCYAPNQNDGGEDGYGRDGLMFLRELRYQCTGHDHSLSMLDDLAPVRASQRLHAFFTREINK